jgi:hypothetical protein
LNPTKGGAPTTSKSFKGWATRPFSAPFEITNTGYLTVHIDNVVVIFSTVEYESGPTFTDASVGNKGWDNFDLSRGGTKTILPYFSNGALKKADVVIAIDYRFLWRKWRWFFRFQGIHIENWQWTKQLVGDLEAPLNKTADYALEQHKKANSK